MTAAAFLRRHAIVLFVSACAVVSLHAQVPYESGELRLALKKLNVLGSVLYISAHPDDENTAFLATMAKHRLLRTGNLSLTRGEGGQNLLGAEQGDALGVIRTQELLGARSFDGAEQFFTRAVDFGYSKSTDETIRFWGKEEILADVVWVIRTFRPDVIVSRFTPERGGHGNHTASAVLAAEAFRAAADPTRFPEQLRFVQPWGARRLVWNAFRLSGTDTAGSSVITEDLGCYSPLLGLSLGELAGKGRSMHKSQGFGASELRGTLPQQFVHMDGDPATRSLFDGIDTTWRRIPGGEHAHDRIAAAVRAFDPEHPHAILPVLLEARDRLQRLGSDPWLEVKRAELERVIIACAGLHSDAHAAVPHAVPGSRVPVTITMLNRSPARCTVKAIGLTFLPHDSVVSAPLVENVPAGMTLTLALPDTMPFSGPYWLSRPRFPARYTFDDPLLAAQAESPPVATATVAINLHGHELTINAPVRYRWVDPTGGELYRPFLVMPPLSLTLTNPVLIFGPGARKEVTVLVRNLAPRVKGAVQLTLPQGWHCDPPSQPFVFDSAAAEKSFRFSLRPDSGAADGDMRAVAVSGTKRYDQTVTVVSYPHIPPQTFLTPARGRLVRLDIRAPKYHIGFIPGAGDQVPAALSMLGYRVTVITDEELESGDLSRYDALLAGIRAHNTNPKLRAAHERLMNYVLGGGRYIVQYLTRPRSDVFPIGPHPLRITQDRVSVEDSPVQLVVPGHPLLTTPYRITHRDFDGWVQERGLYFADDATRDYEMPLAFNDPGERAHRGGLVYARYGAGYFIYTGLSFFRQLPAGVPGAYRLIVNLLSQDVGR